MFYGTYKRRLGKDGRITVPKEIRQELEREGYTNFWPILEVEHTDKGNRHVYLNLKPSNDADIMKNNRLWIPPVTRKLINPFEERDLLFIGVDEYVELWCPTYWDEFKREYIYIFDELIEEFTRKREEEKVKSQTL